MAAITGAVGFGVVRKYTDTEFAVHSSSQKYIKRAIKILRGGAVGSGTALQVGRSRVRFPLVSLEFFIDIILLAVVLPWGRIRL